MSKNASKPSKQSEKPHETPLKRLRSPIESPKTPRLLLEALEALVPLAVALQLQGAGRAYGLRGLQRLLQGAIDLYAITVSVCCVYMGIPMP